MSKIRLYRPEENFNKNCSYKILIGEQVFTELKNGEEKIIELPDELHHKNLKAKIHWCGSEKIALPKVEENERLTIRGNEFLNKKMPLLGAIFPLIGLMIFGLKIISKEVGVGILILFLIGIIASLSIWRNKWINIKKENL